LGRRAPAIDDEAMGLLEAYAWPGNARELRNVIERAVLLADASGIGVEHLPEERLTRAPFSTAPAPPDSKPADSAPPTPIDPRRARLIDALSRAEGNQTRAAQLLGISRRALIAQVAKHGLPRPRNGSRP
jgi:DNA-binding NtrC family response regulator